LRKLEWIAWLSAIVLAAAVLFAGSVFFYWGAWNILIYPDHTKPAGIEYVFAIFGGLIIIFGATVAWDAGKKLTGTQIIATSLTHLVVAPSLIYTVYSITDPYLITVLIPPALLSNIILDAALLIGHLQKTKPLQHTITSVG